MDAAHSRSTHWYPVLHGFRLRPDSFSLVLILPTTHAPHGRGTVVMWVWHDSVLRDITVNYTM